MKTIIALLFLAASFTGWAQNQVSEKELIQAAVNEYVEGRNNGEVERLRQAFLPNASLKGVARNQEQAIMPIEEYLNKQTPGRKHDCVTEVRFIDFVKDVAVAQVVITYKTHTYYDYLVLMKVTGKWVIADKFYTRVEAGETLPDN